MIYAATGHRPDKLGGYGADVERRLAGFALSFLSQTKPERVISGMAQGWDMAFAHAAYQLRIPFIAAIPFETQASRWPVTAQEHWRALLGCAESVHIVSPGPYAIWKMQTRNRWMVDNCTALAALWNGSDGGTANCVRYAEPLKPIINLWDRWNRWPA